MPNIFKTNPDPENFTAGQQVFVNMSRGVIFSITSLFNMSHEAVGSGVVTGDGKEIEIYPHTVIGFHTDGWGGWKPWENMYPQSEGSPSTYEIASMAPDKNFEIMKMYGEASKKFYYEGKTVHAFFSNHCGRNNARVLDHIFKDTFQKFRPIIFNKRYCMQNFGTSTIGIEDAHKYHLEMFDDICRKPIQKHMGNPTI